MDLFGQLDYIDTTIDESGDLELENIQNNVTDILKDEIGLEMVYLDKYKKNKKRW